MYKVAVVGDKDSILGFKALGFSVFPVSDSCEAGTVIKSLAEDDYAVVYVIEQIAVNIDKVLEEYRGRRFPAVIPIPGNRGSLGVGMSNIKKLVEKAVGADILFND